MSGADIIHLNGRLMAMAEARIDPSDRGLTLGDGLFETLRARDGGILRLSRHLERLRAGAAVLGLDVPTSDRDLGRHLAETLAANGVDDGVLRLTLTRGPSGRGLAPSGPAAPTLMITASGYDGAPGPASAVIATVTRRNEHSPLSRCKCLNFLDNILARREAEKRGADEALLLNSNGRLAEAAAANLFVVLGGALLTPPLADGALPGVMRADVMDRLGGRECPLAPEDLALASEAFLTNSLGIRPLTRVDGVPLADGNPGPVTREAMAGEER
jgi:branched-chain amino acid aminotransferase